MAGKKTSETGKDKPASARQQVLDQLQTVDGIGPKLAERIYEKFKTKSIDAVKSTPAEVSRKVKGLSAKVAEKASLQLSQPLESHIARTKQKLEEEELIGITYDLVRKTLSENSKDAKKQRDEAKRVLDKYRQDILSWPNVTAVRVELRKKNGVVVHPLQYCIQVSVKQKLLPGDPKIVDLFPDRLDNVKVDVVQQEFQLMHGDPGEYAETLRGGVGIAKQPVSHSQPFGPGTLGGVFVMGSDAVFLTNEHVAGKAPSIVIQPPSGKVPPGAASAIGAVIGSQRNNEVDCAIIKSSLNRDLAFEFLGLGENPALDFLALTDADLHLTIATKSGAATKVTDGLVVAVDADVEVAGTLMKNQILVEAQDDRKIIHGGDSGSCLLVKDPGAGAADYHIVGLVHAGSTDGMTLVAAHIDFVRKKFPIETPLT